MKISSAKEGEQENFDQQERILYILIGILFAVGFSAFLAALLGMEPEYVGDIGEGGWILALLSSLVVIPMFNFHLKEQQKKV
jgi:uncharacterized membrane protein